MVSEKDVDPEITAVVNARRTHVEGEPGERIRRSWSRMVSKTVKSTAGDSLRLSNDPNSRFYGPKPRSRNRRRKLTPRKLGFYRKFGRPTDRPPPTFSSFSWSPDACLLFASSRTAFNL